MRSLILGNHKSGLSVEISLDTVPASALVLEPLPSQGIEVELLLYDARTLLPASAAVMSELFGKEPWRTPEVLAHCCELKTAPHRTAGELLAEYRARTSWLCRWAESRGLIVVPLANEPLERICPVTGSGFIRQAIEQKYGRAPMELNASSCTQINTHVGDGDALLALYRGLVRIAPVLAGMFASSPFVNGRPAGVLSFRHVVRRMVMNGGDPELLPATLRWEEYLRSHQALTTMGSPWFPVLFALNGMVRLRPDRMCVESGATDVVAEPRHVTAGVELHRRAAYRILRAYRDGEPLPAWFGPEDAAARDAAFRISMLSAVKQGSQGLCCTSELRATPISEIFSQLISWAGEAGVPEDPSLPWAEAEAGLRELLSNGSPAEQMMRTFRELHPDCQDPAAGCPDCRAAVVEVCLRQGRAFHAEYND